MFEFLIGRDIDIFFRGEFGMILICFGFSVRWLDYFRSDIFIVLFVFDVVDNFFVGFDWKVLFIKINDVVLLKFGMD